MLLSLGWLILLILLRHGQMHVHLHSTDARCA